MARASDDTHLSRAEGAVDRGQWDEAYRILAEVDAGPGLEPSSLATFAEAAYISGHPHAAVDAWQRMHGANLKEGDLPGAAEAAVRVCDLLVDAGEFAAFPGGSAEPTAPRGSARVGDARSPGRRGRGSRR